MPNRSFVSPKEEKIMDEERLAAETAPLPEPSAELPAVLPESFQIPENTESSAPADSEIPESLPQKNVSGHRVLRIVLTRIFPLFLLVPAVIVYAVLAVTSVREPEFTAVRFFQSVLSEFTGGADSIRFTETAVTDENAAVHPPELSGKLPETALPIPEIPDSPDSEPVPPEFPLYRLDMSSSAPDALGIINETPYEPDLNALADAGRVIPEYAELAGTCGTSAPVVLILHTHTTEAFADTHADDFRSTDNTKNITAVGKVIADRLTENGIPVLHCTETFDAPDFNMAYYNAALAIRKYIADYPSISYIFDIHRDSIISGDGYVSPVTELDGKSAAQMMFVVGTDHGGSGHTGWRDNLALAVRLQKSLNGDCPTLMRDINLRSASFNEQYTSGSLLVEIGSCASTLDEAKNAAARFAEHLSEEILG